MRRVGGNCERGKSGAGIAGPPSGGAALRERRERARCRESAVSARCVVMAQPRRGYGERDIAAYADSRAWWWDVGGFLGVPLSRLWEAWRDATLEISDQLWR